MKKKLLGFLFTISSGLVIAQSNQFSRPKLVVGIVVDQMRWDYLYRYYERFGNNGFKRLLKNGFSCQNTYLNYIPSYTAPGHTSIFSGAIPAVHGIVGNDWVDQKTGRNQYCAQDDSARGIGGSQQAGKMSPRQMKTTTIGDELRLASNFRSRVFGVALKDRGAIFPAGHTANGAFWFDDSTGNFISSDFYGKNLPAWLTSFNNKKWPEYYLGKSWETLYPIESYTQSIEDENNYEELKTGELKPVFPHLATADNFKQIRSLPQGNTLTFKLAKEILTQEKLGQGSATDMLTISLSSTDYIGHAYGPNSIEVEDMYLRLDKDFGIFLQYLDDEIGEGNYVIFLTADHGGAHNSSFLQDRKVPAGILSEYDLKKELNALLKTKYGSDSLVRAVMNYQVVLNLPMIERKKLNEELIRHTVIKHCEALSGMAYVIDLNHVNESQAPSFMKEKLLNGYCAIRCGMIALIYEPAWYSDGPKGTTHGTWNPYDTHIPLLWYGWHIPAGETFEKTEVTDIAATLGALLHIQIPNGANGKVIFQGQ